MSTPDGQDFDLHKALEEGTQRMSLRDLEQKGYQRVKVLDEKAVENLITKAVARVVTTQAGEERTRILADSRKELDRLMREHKAVKSKADLLKSDRDELIQQVEALQKELELQSDLEEENLHKKYLEGTASMQAQVEDLRRQLQAAMVEAEANRKQAEALVPQLQEARRAAQDAATLKARVASEEAKAREAQAALEAVRRDLSGEQARARAAEQARGDVVAQVLRLQQEADASRTEIKKLRSELARMEQEAAKVLAGSEKDARSEQQRLARELEGAKAAAETALRAETRALTAARAEVERLGAEINRLNADVERLRRESAEEKVKGEAARQAETALRADAKALAEERDRLAAALAEATNELSFARARIAEQEKLMDSRRESAIVIADNLQEIEEKRAEEDRELERLRAEAAGLRQSEARLAAEAASLREDLRRMYELLAREQDLARAAQGEAIALHGKSLELQGRAGELERYVGELRQARGRLEALLEAERLKPVVAPKIALPKAEVPKEIRDRLERLQALVERARKSSEAAAGASTATRETATQLRTLVAKQAKPPAPKPPRAAAPREGVGLDGPGLLGDFLRRIKMKELFQKHVPVQDRPGRRHPSETLVELVEAAAAGGSKPPKNPEARRLEVVGAPAGATLDELRRFQARLSPRAVRQLERVHDGLRHHLVPPPPKPEKLVLDVDRPEIRLGRKGRATALVCFDGARGEFWKARLGAGRGELPFLKECLAKIPGGFARGRILLRLDPSFASEPVVRYLDRAGAAYVAPAADDKGLRADARKAKLREISGGWAVGEMERRLHPIRATKGRYVVLRRRSSGKADGPAPTFVDGRHAYHVFLVDRRTAPARAWTAWSERTASVDAERALLKGFGESPLLGRDRRSRAASFATYLLGSDVLQWFKRAGLPEKQRAPGHEALRTDLLMLAPPDGKRETAVLVLPKKDRRRRLYREVADRLSRLRPAGAFKLGR